METLQLMWRSSIVLTSAAPQVVSGVGCIFLVLNVWSLD